ncbi:Fic family protein [Azospirillum halopraeferens]|uniref:Fic family protein n=1 Tax=Azospirillum halopraeferens TaxID=34010 RepID=UPI000418B991|nr:Fic family protein [Azospirillum halopraeferens]
MAERIIFTGQGDAAQDRRIQREASAGKLRKLHAGVYTDNLTDPAGEVAIRNAFQIAAHLCGPVLLSGRSALEARPSVVPAGEGQRTGYLFLTDPHGTRRRAFSLPGLELRVVPGPPAREGDHPLLGLVLPSRARMLLENLAPSRARDGGPGRTVGAAGVEEKLERICAQEREAHLNQIRDAARALAPALGLAAEFERLDAIVGALLGTRTARLSNPAARAMADGQPYDSACVNRLLTLRRHLEDTVLPSIPDTATAPGSRTAAAFIEAYFSNYIEGTRFPVRQAHRIVFEGERPAQRPKDSHDVLATYQQLVNLGGRLPSSLRAAEFMDEIRARHADLMAVRPECAPGEWKADVNIAGNTTFVLPVYVPGTLAAAVEILGGLSHPFARAAFIHFMLTDIHPFADGNGRISRIMMTKELVGSGLARIVVPTVYRDDYLGSLRALTRHGDPASLVRALAACQKVTAACAAPSVDRAIALWASTYAFVEAGVNARLEMPNAARAIVWREEIPAPEDYWRAEDAAKPPLQM